MASGRAGTARADVVGSLLRPASLRQARKRAREGKIGAAERRGAQDGAVLEAIALQRAVGLDVITVGRGHAPGGRWLANGAYESIALDKDSARGAESVLRLAEAVGPAGRHHVPGSVPSGTAPSVA